MVQLNIVLPKWIQWPKYLTLKKSSTHKILHTVKPSINDPLRKGKPPNEPVLNRETKWLVIIQEASLYIKCTKMNGKHINSE